MEKILFLSESLNFIKPYRDLVHLKTGFRKDFMKQTVAVEPLWLGFFFRPFFLL